MNLRKQMEYEGRTYETVLRVFACEKHRLCFLGVGVVVVVVVVVVPLGLHKISIIIYQKIIYW